MHIATASPPSCCLPAARVTLRSQRCHWRAHHTTINSVDVITDRGLLVLACKDTNVTIWSLDGGMLGTLGEQDCQGEEESGKKGAQGHRFKEGKGNAVGKAMSSAP